MNSQKPPFNLITNLQRCWVTWNVIIISCIPYIILQRHGVESISSWFMPVTLSELLQPNTIWKLWSPVFVHYELLHLVTNLYLWWLFASKIEQESRRDLIIVVVISAAFANMSQWLFYGSKFGGLSGVVYALLAYLWILRCFGGKQQYYFDPILGLLLIALIPVSFTGVLGKFANLAHLGGLVAGALLALAYLVKQNRSDTIKSS